MPARAGTLLLLAFAAASFLAAGWLSPGQGATAHAQVFGPPMTVFGSVTADPPLPEGVPVDAVIGDTICGSGETEFYGGTPVYYMDVVSREQKPGCGTRGAIIRFKVGDTFANETIAWDAGPAELLLTIGSATQVAVPTPTPVPDQTSAATATQPPPTPIPTRTPTVAASASPTATLTATATRTSTPTATPTLAGSLITRQPTPGTGATQDPDDGGGFPIWAAVVIGVGAIVAVGGGIGFLMARSRTEEDEVLD